MELKSISTKLLALIEKYKYAILVLLIGLALLLIPGKRTDPQNINSASPTVAKQEMLTQESLAQILQSVEGAGKVKVLLSTGAGEQTIYQTDTDNDRKSNTVIVADSERNENGLIQQINPAVYKGAVVVCQGADSPTVRLAITQAVSKITGLGTDAICVLKMQ